MHVEQATWLHSGPNGCGQPCVTATYERGNRDQPGVLTGISNLEPGTIFECPHCGGDWRCPTLTWTDQQRALLSLE